MSFEFPLATIFCHSNNSSDRKGSSDISFTFEGRRVTNFESTVLKLKSLKSFLAIIIIWKVNVAIKDRKENTARITATTMIILANNFALLQSNANTWELLLLSLFIIFFSLYSFDNRCFCENFVNNE